MYAFPLYSLTNLPPWNARMHTEEEEGCPRSFIIAIESIAFSRSGSTIDKFPRNSPRSTRFDFVSTLISPRSASNGHAETRRNGKGLESSHATRWLSLFARLIALRAAGGREATFDHETARRHAGNNGRPRWWPRTTRTTTSQRMINGFIIALPRDLYLIGSWNVYKLHLLSVVSVE